jgi:ABC-type multidrug transport system ATPase subunit
VIEIDRVSKQYGRVRALHHVSLDIEPGDRIALVGTNGSGKTTLLRALLGLIRVEGHVRIGGVDVAKAPELALRELAYVPQISPPLDAPVGEVLATYGALRGVQTQACLDCAERMGLELEGALRTRFRDLSGGMRQKLLAAMALAVNPRILVCDEPTANLDAAARAAFIEQLERRASDSILIVCSHHEADVKSLVTRVVELRDGVVMSNQSVSTRSAQRLRLVP